jgi:hypothetical protein
MLRVKVRWSGFIGSPGWTNFYFDSGDGTFYDNAEAGNCADRVASFLNVIRPRFPDAVTWQIQSDVEAIAAPNGELVSVHNAGARAPIVGGAAAASYSGASGIVVTWRTNGVRNGRRVRGRTFLVPAATAAYGNDGTIGPTTLEDINAAAAQLIAAPGQAKLGVWSRPSAVGATDGAFHVVTAASVPDMAAVLRSRRG